MNPYEENYQKIVRESQKTKWENRFRHLCLGLGLPRPQEQFRFHPTRRWQFDFCWPDHKVAFEIEGGIWRKGGGGHSHPLNIERDIDKYNAATLLGWRLYRITGKMLKVRTLLTGDGAEIVKAALNVRRKESGAAKAERQESEISGGGLHSGNDRAAQDGGVVQFPPR